jgi:hypothetical protein
VKANFGFSSSLEKKAVGTIHVSHPDGEAKFWLEPTIELARNIGLGSAKVNEAERLIKSRKKEITDAWNNHFGS